MTRNTFIALLSILAFSCASAPPKKDIQTGVDLPQTWKLDLQTETAIDSAWWNEFNDPKLNEILVQAFGQNFNLAIAAANLQTAAAQARIAGAPLFPQVDLSTNGARTKQNFIGLPIPGLEGGVLSSTVSSFGLSMNLSWELDLWGRLSADKSAAVAQVQASRADFIGARLSLAAQISKTWFTAIEAKRQVELSQATVENWRAARAQVKRRYESGLTSSLDYRLSLSNFAIAEANLASSQSQYETTLRQLETLLRQYPSASIAVSPELPEISSDVPAGLPADLLNRRPDLAAAERRVAATHAGVSSAKRALLPRISLTGSGGTSSNELGDLLKGDFSVWRIAGNILQPLFQGGRLRANVKLAKSQADIALLNYQQTALNAFAEVENSLASERYLNQRQTALEEATHQALAARNLAETQYGRGLIDFITMLETQRSAFETERLLLTVRRQRLEARINLYLALGGGFSVKNQSNQI
ncbi:efflux transporter outer membrane subunit [candidate division KSB1 bacterium]|nr:efflux transporter outer membrane subunit [candidate division KSB1 bacterium]TDI93051.1 MAG: efflux transporter outer membrane subunit [Caldithrix sp.]